MDKIKPTELCRAFGPCFFVWRPVSKVNVGEIIVCVLAILIFPKQNENTQIIFRVHN